MATTIDYAEVAPARGRLAARLATAFCFYPVLLLGSLHATWFIAWVKLGRRPVHGPWSVSRPVGAPYWVGSVLLLGTVPGVMVHVALLIAAYVGRRREGRTIGPRGVALAVSSLALWAAALALLCRDPWGVMEWWLG